MSNADESQTDPEGEPSDGTGGLIGVSLIMFSTVEWCILSAFVISCEGLRPHSI